MNTASPELGADHSAAFYQIIQQDNSGIVVIHSKKKGRLQNLSRENKRLRLLNHLGRI